MDRDAYLLEVCRYVELNPVRARMVDEAAQWPWSSYTAHTGRVASPPRLDTLAVLRFVSGGPVATAADATRAALRHAERVEQGRGVSLWDRGLRQQIYLGDEGFVRRMQSVVGLAPSASLQSVPPVQRTLPARPLPSDFAGGDDRDVSIWRAFAEGRHTMSAIAVHLG